MKRFLYITIAVLGLVSCSKDLTEFYDRADQIEATNKAQAQTNKELEAANAALKQQALLLQARLDSFANAYKNLPQATMLVAMAFSAAENPSLTEDLECTISSNGTIECWLPQLSGSKELIPRFSFLGTGVTINDQKATSGSSKYDFSTPVKLTVKGVDKTVEYMVYVYTYTGLPIMYIDTEGAAPIKSKTVYLNAHMRLVEDAVTRSPGEVTEADLQIKGRGNSTWGQPKKPYRLKFNEKIRFFGEHKDKSWVLLANYSDKSMIRNDLALTMGKRSNLDWTPGGHFVELILNGQYDGTYMLCEKIKIDNNRVAVGDDGFLIEVDERAERDSGCVFTYAPHINYSIEIKEPEDVSFGDENYNYITNFLKMADDALFSENFTDPNEGWQKYMDIDSFVDWYIIHEISKNEVSMFHFSTYMNLQRGGKLKMGPIWDFDIAFGNVKEAGTTAMLPEGFMLEWSLWYQRLMQDPAFLSRLRHRFTYFYNHKEDFLTYINNDAQYLKYAAQENQKRWGTFYHYTYKQYDIWGSYQNEVQNLKEWLNTRMEWMRRAYGI